MPPKLKRNVQIGSITSLTMPEKDVLLTMSTWLPNIDGKITTVTLARRLKVSQSTMWFVMDELRSRGFVKYVKRTMTGHKGLYTKYSYWVLNPDIKIQLDKYNESIVQS